MKLLKIGRSTSNDIVLNDQTISAQHAALYVDDNNQCHIKDLNSTNGTFINDKRISDAQLKSGDVVRLGNCRIDWIKMLKTPHKTVVKKKLVNIPVGEIQSKKRIGRLRETNDIVFSHSDVSSNHAYLIKNKNGEIVIIDNNSTNGTYVNGGKISTSVLHKGDKVMIANKYPLDWEAIYPPRKTIRVLSVAMLAIAAMIAVAVVVWWQPWQPWSPGKNGTAEEIYAYYNKSVVLIYQSYYFEVSVNGETMGRYIFNSDDDIVDLSESGSPMGAFGTGFFVSSDGKIMTNRHVMNPSMTEQTHIKKLKQSLRVMFEQYAAALQKNKPAQAAAYRNAANNIEVSIEVHSTGIAVNDTYVTSWNDFMPCSILGDTGSDEIDLGLIQLNSKRLPEGSSFVDLSKIDTDIIEGKSLFTIGFPHALIIGATSQGVEAQKQSGQISQNRGSVQFGHNLNIDHGSSGSPIFSGKGRLIGVVNAGFLKSAGNFNIGIQSKHAVELLKNYN